MYLYAFVDCHGENKMGKYDTIECLAINDAW